MDCEVPDSIHTSHKEGHWKFLGGDGGPYKGVCVCGWGGGGGGGEGWSKTKNLP